MAPKELQHHRAAAETLPSASLEMLPACCLQITLQNKYFSTDIRITLANLSVLAVHTPSTLVVNS